MPLIISPRQLTQRAELYQQLASLVAAGVGLIQALELVRRSPPNPPWRKPLDHLLRELQDGATFSEALGRLGDRWMPSFDRALIQSGEQSGRLDVCFRFLRDYYNERAQLARQVRSDLAYPLIILHLAILVFPPSMLSRLVVQGDIIGFIGAKLAMLLPFYALGIALLWIGQSSHGERWRSALERLFRVVPVLGSTRRSLALARLSMTLESLLNAGVSMVEAWELAADASGSPALRRTVFGWRANVLAGKTPAEAVRESRAFPELFANLYSTGELSGQLDDTLRRLHQYYQEEGLRKMRELARWAPRLVYFLIVLAVAWQIVTFWTNYYSQIGGMAF